MGLTPVDQFVLALVRMHGDSVIDRVSRVVYRKADKRIEIWIQGYAEGDGPMGDSPCYDSEILRAGLESNGEEFTKNLAEVLFRRIGCDAVPGYSPDPNVMVWLRYKKRRWLV